MKTVYLDWNVFNKSENPGEEKPLYDALKEIILSEVIIVPFSNAHINDLYRGYMKNPNFVAGHLENIKLLTNKLCITKYWGEKEVTWHYRDPQEFLDSTISAMDSTAASFSGLFGFTDDPLIQVYWELKKTSLRMQPVPENFRTIYQTHPFFGIMYPRTKSEMNMLAMCEDIYDFSFKIKSDFALYRNFKKFLLELKAKLPQQRRFFDAVQHKLSSNPKHLSWDDLWDIPIPGLKHSLAHDYDRILTLFTTTDIRGYRQDDKFANLIDDALHCYYGAQCDYFVTLDKKCADKAIKVYNSLGIKTEVVTPSDLVKYIVSNNALVP